MFCKITEPEIASLQFFNNGNGETISCACETDRQTDPKTEKDILWSRVSVVFVYMCVCV